MDAPRHLKLIIAALLFFLAIGCTSTPTFPATLPPVPGASGPTLAKYPSATHAVISTPTSDATAIPIPTATPSTYTVTAGDTLGTIAEQFGLQLRDIQAANPGVLSESLSIGQLLKIPA